MADDAENCAGSILCCTYVLYVFLARFTLFTFRTTFKLVL
jgi:hypothetical protein